MNSPFSKKSECLEAILLTDHCAAGEQENSQLLGSKESRQDGQEQRLHKLEIAN